MPHLAKTLVTFLVASLLMAIPASAAPAPAAPEASASATCSVRNIWRKLGASYVNALSTRRVNCPDARDFVRRYHRCRHRNGGKKGRCPRLLRFRCEERRFNTSSGLSFDANMLCTRGNQRIRQTYTEIY